MADRKVVINLATGLEGAERVTVAFLLAGAPLAPQAGAGAAPAPPPPPPRRPRPAPAPRPHPPPAARHSHGLVDPSIVRSRAGVRAVAASLAILAATAGLQAAIFALSG